MPPDPVFVTTHIHTDGPIPGPHSLLTLTSVAFRRFGGPISTFETNVRELPGATLHPGALQRWRRHPDDWLASRRAGRAPSVAMSTFLRWVDKLPGEPAFVADPTDPDYLFLYWYLVRFAGRWPFDAVVADPVLRGQLSEPFCSLTGCRTTVA
jgi:hypothetical protein